MARLIKCSGCARFHRTDAVHDECPACRRETLADYRVPKRTEEESSGTGETLAELFEALSDIWTDADDSW